MALALAGRSAVVTGASRGIGAETARALAAAGARVAMVARTQGVLSSLAHEIGRDALAVGCDLRSASAVDTAARTILDKLSGAPDILVNNAGVFHVAPVDQLEPEAFTETLTLNLIAPFMLVRAFLPGMRARRSGHIVTIGSVADRHIFAGNAAYSASKYGLRAMHEVLRTELRGSGIRATLISPGPVDTALWEGVEGRDSGRFPSRDAMLPAQAVASAIVFAVTQPEDVTVEELRLART